MKNVLTVHISYKKSAWKLCFRVGTTYDLHTLDKWLFDRRNGRVFLCGGNVEKHWPGVPSDALNWSPIQPTGGTVVVQTSAGSTYVLAIFCSPDDLVSMDLLSADDIVESVRDWVKDDAREWAERPAIAKLRLE